MLVKHDGDSDNKSNNDSDIDQEIWWEFVRSENDTVTLKMVASLTMIM